MTDIHHITIVEDDLLLRHSIANLLRKQNYLVSEFESSEGVYEFIKNGDSDLIICDIVLPTSDGYKLIEKLNEFPHLGKIFISGKTALDDRIKGLSLGADDYICKPLDSTELLLRVRSLLNRLNTKEKTTDKPGLQSFLNLTLNLESRQVWGSLGEETLGLAEHELLLLLLAHQGRICDRETMYTMLASDKKYSNGRALDNLIKRLRKKLASAGGEQEYIVTFRGQGYMLASA